ncbi:MAG: large conductance mechanosensitive channel protein MscL [Actinomycetes bacterium]
MKSLWSDFKKFLVQGDLVAVAVAFVIGAAFKTLVDAFVGAIMMPLVGAIFGQPSFTDLTFKVGDGVVAYGLFINAVINFLIIAATLFVIVQSYEKLRNMRSSEEKAADPTELDVLIEIRDSLAQRQG